MGELGHGELKELGVDLLGDRLAILKCAKNDKPKKPRAKRRPEKVKKITKEKEVVEKEEGDDEIARVLSTVKSKTKFVDVSPLPVKNERIKSENPFMKQKTNVHSDEEDQSPVQFSVNLQNNQRKRRSQEVLTDEEPKVVRPFSSGPIWAADKEIQEDCVSSSTNTNFAIVLGQGKPLSRNTEPVIKCSLSSLSKNNKPTRTQVNIDNRLGPKEKSISSRLGARNVGVKNRLGDRTIKARLGL